jgi:SAM-dependent methyltransferase
MYEREAAEVYDMIYRQRKDYAAEAEGFAAVIARHLPGATSVLDVACGTGEHLRFLGKMFSHVEGLDLSESMCEVAREKLAGVVVHRADMRDFELNRRFDGIVCPFSSIAHAGTVDGLNAAISCMARHLTPGGVLAIEPWIFPKRLNNARPVGHTTAGQLSHDVVIEDDRIVSTVSRFSVTGRVAHMDIHYLFGDQSGVRNFVDSLDLTLFTRQEYEDAFRDSGCDVTFREGSPWQCGLFVGVRR